MGRFEMKNPTYIYIAGAMTGLPLKNFPAFMKAAKDLRKAGYKVVNPAELETIKPICTTWEQCLRRDLIHILGKCYAIAMLSGWKRSRGAQLEASMARQLDMQVHSVNYWLEKGDK